MSLLTALLLGAAAAVGRLLVVRSDAFQQLAKDIARLRLGH